MVKHQNTTSRYIIDSTIYEDRLLGTFYSPETKREIKDVRFTLEHVLCLCMDGSEYEFVVWDLPTHTNKDGSPHDESAWYLRTFHGRYFIPSSFKKNDPEIYQDEILYNKQYFFKKAEDLAIECYTSCSWHRKNGDEYRYLEKKYIETMKKNIKKGKKYFEDILEVRKLENERVKKVLTN